MALTTKVPLHAVKKSKKSAQATMLEHAANELVFAVVGHVGSGTTKIAEALRTLLQRKGLPGGAYDVEVIKGRDVIAEWAAKNGKILPHNSQAGTLNFVQGYQDLGDLMRKEDHGAVAKSFVLTIRRTRAKKTGVNEASAEPITPDGQRRAYILDSIRHPAEVELLRHIYQDAFFLLGVVCEEQKRLERVIGKYKNAGKTAALEFMRRDEKAKEKHGQRVGDAFHLSDFFIDNTENQFRSDKTPNPAWDINEKLSRLLKIITHAQLERPEHNETAMYYAHGAGLRSACLSRQVGAALVDRRGNIVATGCNEVPRAGGGVYGEGFDVDGEEDHRCAFRQKDGRKPFCSQSEQQNEITQRVIEDIESVVKLDEETKGKLTHLVRHGRVGDLIEFSRAVHAEMDAILTAARKGISPVGTRLFVTTFPCHYCARHIVSAGVDEVQFIEPYPKSQALELHSDSIQTTETGWQVPSETIWPGTPGHGQVNRKTLFRPFSGIAPRLYRKAFVKDRDLKNNETGVMEIGDPPWGTPWHLRRASYAQLEAELAKE